MNVGDVIGWVLKLKFFEGYRTKVGAAALLVGGLFSVIQMPEFMAAFPFAENLPEWLVGIGTYAGVIGSRYKDDYQPE